MSKKEKHWTIEIAEIREAVRKLESKRNKIGHTKWLLNRKNLSLSHQIADLNRMEEALMNKHSKVKFTRKMNEGELEKGWLRKCKEMGIDRLLE